MSARHQRSPEHAHWDMLFRGWVLATVAGLDPETDLALDEILGVLAVLGSGVAKLLQLPPGDPKLLALVEYLQATQATAQGARP